MQQWNTIKENQSNRPEYKKKEIWDIDSSTNAYHH
jgi:hypothetical protein